MGCHAEDPERTLAQSVAFPRTGLLFKSVSLGVTNEKISPGDLLSEGEEDQREGKLQITWKAHPGSPAEP